MSHKKIAQNAKQGACIKFHKDEPSESCFGAHGISPAVLTSVSMAGTNNVKKMVTQSENELSASRQEEGSLLEDQSFLA
jgi:hypothetical protein